MTCTNRRVGLMSKAGRLVLSRSRSGLWWMSAEQDALSLLLLQSSSSRDAPTLALGLSPPGSYTSLLLLLLRPPGSYVRLWSLLSVALGLLLLRVSVLSVSMVLVLVLLEGQRELKGGGCGELLGSTSTRPPKSAIATLASLHVQLTCPFQRPASAHQHSTSVMRFTPMFGARPP